MQPEKKQLELLLMHYFRERSSEFPKGKLIASESPDFILMLKKRNSIGIELTRLNPQEGTSYGHLKSDQKSIWQEIIITSKNLFTQSSPFRMLVKFQFSDKIPIEEERKHSVAARATNAIRNAVQDKKPGNFFYNIIHGDILPEGMENILLVNHPELKVPVWEQSESQGFDDDITTHIQTTIQKKEKKLHLYQKQRLNFYWLIIFADTFHGNKKYNLSNKLMNRVFLSNFQQVYLFDLFISKVFQLNRI